jgi:transposase
LDCLETSESPFSKGTLVAFRQRLIEKGLDRRLIERTIELAERSKAFGARALRAALDSSPLWGAGRVEDSYNLMGHALRKALGVIAQQQGRGLAQVAQEAGAAILGGTSLKAALDLNWDDPDEREQALGMILATLDSVQSWLAGQNAAITDPTVQESLATAQQVRDQDVETGAEGIAKLRQGVAKERRISVEDAEMRHGRKSHSQRVDGYKRHVLRDLDSQLVCAVGLTPANAPESSVTESIMADLEAQGSRLRELHIDRAYLSSLLVRQRPAELLIYCRAWPVRNGNHFPKTAFHLDWEQQRLRCPQNIEMPFEPGGVVHFPTETCAGCPQREQCTSSPRGRSVSIHPDERLISELRERQHTAAGRAKLRERVAVEHTLAHIGRWQGSRARYRGTRKNLFDLRRAAVVHNLFVISHSHQMPMAA